MCWLIDLANCVYLWLYSLGDALDSGFITWLIERILSEQGKGLERIFVIRPGVSP